MAGLGAGSGVSQKLAAELSPASYPPHCSQHSLWIPYPELPGLHQSPWGCDKEQNLILSHDSTAHLLPCTA